MELRLRWSIGVLLGAWIFWYPAAAIAQGGFPGGASGIPGNANFTNLTASGTLTATGTQNLSGTLNLLGATTLTPPFFSLGAAPTTATSHCSVAANSTDNDGGITTDATGAASCAIVFATGYAKSAFCVVNQNNAAAIAQTAYAASLTKTGFTLTLAASVISGSWSYHCGGL